MRVSIEWRWILIVALSQFVASRPNTEAAETHSAPPRTRTFELEYRASVTGLASGQTARVWIPVPSDSREQTVRELAREFPCDPETGTDLVYDNRVRYFSCVAPETGKITLVQRFLVERLELHGLERQGEESVRSVGMLAKYLRANRRVPIDGRPLKLLAGIDLPTDKFRLARTLYDVVDNHVTYDKSQPGYGNGDAVWVCDSRTGNCTDFHSLFISLVRSQGIPARFEIGFPLPEERGSGRIAGYHCWANFFTAGVGWMPVDISEADKNASMKEYYFGNLTENRVSFSTGRDITLVPPQDGPPLNYFIDPYVEVAGKAWPADRVTLEVTYRDR